MEESNPAAETLKQSLEGKQELQELKPQESIEADQKDPLDIRVNEEIIKRKGRIVKKLPRGWRNKKIPTEGFSPGEKVISSHYLPIPPGLKTIPSQLPQVFTIRKVLSMEHLEIIKESNGDVFIVRGEDIKHYNPP